MYFIKEIKKDNRSYYLLEEFSKKEKKVVNSMFVSADIAKACLINNVPGYSFVNGERIVITYDEEKK